MNGTTDDTNLCDLLADGSIAALHFYTGAASRSTRAFALELASVLSGATAKNPLVITSDHELTAIYRLFGRAELMDAYGRTLRLGLRFSDLDSPYSGAINIETQVAAVGHAGTVTLPDGGRWLEPGRTPATVARHELPTFDSQRVSTEIVALVARWKGAAKLVAIEEPAPKFQDQFIDAHYSTEPDLRSPAEIDPMDPIRLIPGALNDLRERRKAAGLVKPSWNPLDRLMGRS